MAFTTQSFTFVFFPICFVIYYLVTLLQTKSVLTNWFNKYRVKDLALVGISCCFYMWACFDDICRFLVYIVFIYVLGILIQKMKKSKYQLVFETRDLKSGNRYIPIAFFSLVISVCMIVYILIHFKYNTMFTNMWNYLFKDSLAAKSIIAPLGISFITFSAISYLADIYMEKEEAGNLIDCALYMTFFPKVVSGPIILWRDFKVQIIERKVTLTLLSDGLSRIMIGFAKKLILADTFGACIASMASAVDIPTAFGVGVLYMLQIYYDFSGYSDIAIGLSNMLGFSFAENFNFPYLSCSITEFWRRWHISLGRWFREYIYFPLGGSRKGRKRAIINVAIVFLITGIWHGAGWTYMLWGIINGVCNIIEKLIANKMWYLKTPKIIKWFVTMSITYWCWELFRFEDFWTCKEWFKVMFGITQFSVIPYSWQYYFDFRMIILICVAMVGAVLFGLPTVQHMYKKVIETTYGYFVRQIIYVILFVISILFMVNSTYSPFIYFQY